MLILTRRPEESLQIGPEIRVTILGVKGNQIRLGIAAPKSVVIDREEVHQRKQREKTENVDSPAAAVSEVTRIREKLQDPGAAPGVKDLQEMLMIVERLIAAGSIALKVMDVHGHDLAAFHHALVELRPLLKQVHDALRICERQMWDIRYARAPAAASEDLFALIIAYRGDIDDLLWCLPTQHRRARA